MRINPAILDRVSQASIKEGISILETRPLLFALEEKPDPESGAYYQSELLRLGYEAELVADLLVDCLGYGWNSK